MAFDVYVCIHAGSVVLVSSDKLLDVLMPQRSRRVLSVLDTRGSEDEDEVQLGASNAARALLAALELERGEDAAGGADRDELIEEKAAGARLSVERDPAGQRGARRAGRMQMKREPRGWRDASKAFLSLHRVTRKLPQLCKRPAGSESEPRRGLTCIRRGAYGAVGFSGVKDARKSVLFADALASAATLCARTALRLQVCCISAARLLHFDCRRTAFR